MKVKNKKSFKNGTVYCLELNDGMLIETTDTFFRFTLKMLLAESKTSWITRILETDQNDG